MFLKSGDFEVDFTLFTFFFFFLEIGPCFGSNQRDCCADPCGGDGDRQCHGGAGVPCVYWWTSCESGQTPSEEMSHCHRITRFVWIKLKA